MQGIVIIFSLLFCSEASALEPGQYVIYNDPAGYLSMDEKGIIRTDKFLEPECTVEVIGQPHDIFLFSEHFGLDIVEVRLVKYKKAQPVMPGVNYYKPGEKFFVATEYLVYPPRIIKGREDPNKLLIKAGKDKFVTEGFKRSFAGFIRNITPQYNITSQTLKSDRYMLSLLEKIKSLNVSIHDKMAEADLDMIVKMFAVLFLTESGKKLLSDLIPYLARGEFKINKEKCDSDNTCLAAYSKEEKTLCFNPVTFDRSVIVGSSVLMHEGQHALDDMRKLKIDDEQYVKNNDILDSYHSIIFPKYVEQHSFWKAGTIEIKEEMTEKDTATVYGAHSSLISLRIMDEIRAYEKQYEYIKELSNVLVNEEPMLYYVEFPKNNELKEHLKHIGLPFVAVDKRWDIMKKPLLP